MYDIFVSLYRYVLKKAEEILVLKVLKFSTSVLKFTYEIRNNKLSFLDLNIEIMKGKYSTSVQVKKNTANGQCLNYISQAPEKYKIRVITTLLHRAYKNCSTWEYFHQEVSTT